MENDIFSGYGVEIKLASPDDFLKVKETLSRVGIPAKPNTLFQSAHVLHKRGRYAIMHFKELFALDGRPTDITENDIGRRNTIANLLAEWGLVTLVDSEKSKAPVVPVSQLKIIPFAKKGEYVLAAKYSIGKKK